MTTKDEALKQALAALEDIHPGNMTPMAEKAWDTAITVCREALAQKDEQEPVAWMLEYQTMTGDTDWRLSWSRIGAGLCNRLQGGEHEKPLYTAPPKRQPLTDAEIKAALLAHFPNDAEPDGSYSLLDYEREITRAIERAHGIGADFERR